MNGHRLDHALGDQDGDCLAGEGAGEAETVAQDGDGDHLVLGHLGHELVIGGLLKAREWGRRGGMGQPGERPSHTRFDGLRRYDPRIVVGKSVSSG